MYVVKGTLIDGTKVGFQTAAEQLGEAAQDFIGALARQENTSPVAKVSFVRSESAAALKLVKPMTAAEKKAAAADKKRIAAEKKAQKKAGGK